MDYSPLRRLLVILLIAATIVAIPVVVILNDDDQSATIGIDETSQPATDALGSIAAIGAPFVPSNEIFASDDDPTAPPDTVRIAVPPSQTVRTGRASYRSTLSSPEVCVATPVPFGRRARITNLNNGRSVICRAMISPVGSLYEVVLHNEAFLEIAELINAPIPVQIDW